MDMRLMASINLLDATSHFWSCEQGPLLAALLDWTTGLDYCYWTGSLDFKNDQKILIFVLLIGQMTIANNIGQMA